MTKLSKSILRILSVLTLILFLVWLIIARPVFTTSIEDGSLSAIKPEDLKNRVIFLSQNALPRDSEHPENLDKTADYIKAQFDQYSPNVNYQTYKVGKSEFKNVVAEFGPATTDVIVIGAHYDAYSEHPAADDNASGVAGLIELGRLLQTLNLKHRVQLVAYTLEEPPHFGSEYMGSYVHAASLYEKQTSVKLMISLEMIGYFSEQSGSQSFPIPLLHLFYPGKGNFIAIVDELWANNAASLKTAINKHTNLAAYSINAPARYLASTIQITGTIGLFNYPAVMVTDTSFYRNHSYHKADDTFEKLNYERMAQVIYGTFKYIELLDNE